MKRVPQFHDELAVLYFGTKLYFRDLKNYSNGLPYATHARFDVFLEKKSSKFWKKIKIYARNKIKKDQFSKKFKIFKKKFKNNFFYKILGEKIKNKLKFSPRFTKAFPSSIKSVVSSSDCRNCANPIELKHRVPILNQVATQSSTIKIGKYMLNPSLTEKFKSLLLKKFKNWKKSFKSCKKPTKKFKNWGKDQKLKKSLKIEKKFKKFKKKFKNSKKVQKIQKKVQKFKKKLKNSKNV